MQRLFPIVSVVCGIYDFFRVTFSQKIIIQAYSYFQCIKRTLLFRSPCTHNVHLQQRGNRCCFLSKLVYEPIIIVCETQEPLKLIKFFWFWPLSNRKNLIIVCSQFAIFSYMAYIFYTSEFKLTFLHFRKQVLFS